MQGGEQFFAQSIESGRSIQGEGAHAAVVILANNQGFVCLCHIHVRLNSVGHFGAFAQLEFLYFACRGLWNFFKANFFGYFVAGQ